MCNPASFIITRERALFCETDSHEDIIKKHKLVDSRMEPAFVRVELIPPDGDYSSPPEKWKLETDQGAVPDWYNPKWAQQMCLLEMPKWWSGRFATSSGVLYYEGRKINKIPNNMTHIGGSLDLRGTQVSDLGQLQSVGGSLDLRGTQVSDLGQLQSVGGYLYLRGTQVSIADLPEGLKPRDVL